MNFLKNRTISHSRDKLLPVYNMASSGVKKVLILTILYTHKGVSEKRTIKEVLYIRVNYPSLNKNIGKYHLPHIWDEVLFNTSELKLK